ncbi:hypothetical protein [Wolbachia endosymbiont (group A) of Lasioglossum morio]|uniref:hypothetical protein n=1 Tax=Wolbachia endosymbiont (group A) of Lasioglossum morio TaxID=2954025 RepID=UPI00223242D6|nr:hypothetical protein [Wolbachia endosymbiont (group A) of Lasioglossum morio]
MTVVRLAVIRVASFFCHPSAQTLGSSLSAISSKTFFYASLLAHKQTFLDPSVWALG